MQNLWDSTDLMLSCKSHQITRLFCFMCKSTSVKFLSELLGHGAADQVTSQVSKQGEQVLKPQSSRLSSKVARGRKPY